MSPRLTDRELEILRLAAKGKSSKEMATAIFISENTVKTHLSRLYRRLGVRSRAEAVAVALATGITSTDSVDVPTKVRAHVRGGQGTVNDEVLARRVVMADPGLSVASVVRVIKVLRRLRMLNDRA